MWFTIVLCKHVLGKLNCQVLVKAFDPWYILGLLSPVFMQKRQMCGYCCCLPWYGNPCAMLSYRVVVTHAVDGVLRAESCVQSTCLHARAHDLYHTRLILFICCVCGSRGISLEGIFLEARLGFPAHLHLYAVKLP